jgi:hypothetical protein
MQQILIKRKVKTVAMQAAITMSTIYQSSKYPYSFSKPFHLAATFSLTYILFSLMATAASSYGYFLSVLLLPLVAAAASSFGYFFSELVFSLVATAASSNGCLLPVLLF